MKSFNVIWENFNARKFEPYNIMPYFINKYIKAENKPKTFDEFKKFIESESMYMFWGRCEYEIIISDWPPSGKEEKWDIHRQIMMNIDIITEILMDNINESQSKKND